MILKKTAVRVKQGDLTIYATSLLVKDLMISNFYQVDKLDSSNTSSGFQRVLDKTRTKRLSDYILDAWKDKDAFLPTSIFLATDKDVAFDNEKNEITFEIEKVCPFNVVDGQHRVEGLIEAAKQNPEIGDFELVANIAVNLEDVSQMCHFLIVNTTQKAVDRAVEQQIISRLTGMVDIEDIPTLPKWIQRQVMKGEDKEALVITNYLNTEPDSPWCQKIRMANEGKDDSNTINQKSFVQSIKGYILSSNNPLAAESDIDRRNKILKNYWKAIDDLLVKKDSDSQTVVYKTIGLELFNIISATVFMKLYNEKNFTVDRIKSMLQHGFSNLPNEHLAVQNPEWWESGGGASNINKAAVRQIATELNKAMNIQKIDDDIQL
jgi:DGQHR domain-containing protein